MFCLASYQGKLGLFGKLEAVKLMYFVNVLLFNLAVCAHCGKRQACLFFVSVITTSMQDDFTTRHSAMGIFKYSHTSQNRGLQVASDSSPLSITQKNTGK